MVQNKEIKKETLKIVKNGDAHEEALILNGKLNESEEHSESEDDFMEHLLVVPSLDKNVAIRNRNLVSESLLGFYSAIENRKEYAKIKQELMGDLVPIKNEKENVPIVEEKLINNDKSQLETVELNGKLEVEKDQKIEVSDEDEFAVRNFSIGCHRARFVPENPPQMFDQFLICRRCTIFFKSRKFRKMHNAFNHRKKRPTGVLTASLNAEPNKIRKRIRSGGKGKLLICDLCSKTFKIKALIRSHMNCHTLEKPLACSLCSYTGKRSYDLKKHHFVHHNPDRIKKKRTRRRKCDKCDEILDSKKAFKLHLRLKHREKVIRKPRIFKRCEKCQEAIYTKKGYKMHMKDKHRDFLYIKCEKCNRRFKTNFRLKKHKSRYATLDQDCRTKARNIGEFNCEHCKATFTLKSYLLLHMKKHEAYTCKICQCVFNSQFSLKYHEFSHLDTEPKCSNCAKVFSSEQKFSNHLKRKVCAANGLTNGHIENGI
ncbi:zinc finger protein draculin-like [Chironomus tepperi]|uniref:zinc finger protein draculin-like n=1 Tax=Chironomus tepperi TaxID=113505 RepID=UPI00391EF8DF